MKYNYFSESPIKDPPYKNLCIRIKEGSITSEKLAKDAVTSDKIADGSVVGTKLADNSITADKLDKLLLALIKSATGTPEDLIYQMSYLFKKIEGMTPITDEEIAQIIAGSYVPEEVGSI